LRLDTTVTLSIGQVTPQPAREFEEFRTIGKRLLLVTHFQVMSDLLQAKVDTLQSCSGAAGHRARGRRLAIGLNSFTVGSGACGGLGLRGFKGLMTAALDMGFNRR
jgi:hypothetical protein